MTHPSSPIPTTRAIIRPVTPGDASGLAAYFASLDATSRRRRLGRTRMPVPGTISDLCSRSIPWRRLWVAEAGGAIVAEATYTRFGADAELRLSVAPGRRDGDRLAARLLERCEAGASRDDLICLHAFADADDDMLHDVLRRAAVRVPEADADVVEYLVPVLQPGKLLRRARRRMGYSQAQVARRIGVSQATVTGWEAGRYRVNAHKVEALGTCLRLSESRQLLLLPRSPRRRRPVVTAARRW